MEVSLASGARTLSRGLRTSDPKVAALGAALLALAYLRSQRGPERLVRAMTLRPGESVEVVLRPGQRRSGSQGEPSGPGLRRDRPQSVA